MTVRYLRRAQPGSANLIEVMQKCVQIQQTRTVWNSYESSLAVETFKSMEGKKKKDCFVSLALLQMVGRVLKIVPTVVF